MNRRGICLKYLLFLAAIIIIFLLAYIASNNKKRIKVKPLVTMLVLQLIFAFLLLNTEVGFVIITAVSSLFDHLLSYAAEGINFVFGGMANEGAGPFFINVLLPIVFISVLIGIAQYIKVLPFIIRYLGIILSKVNGLGKLESYNAVASAVFGQSEVFISVKKQLPYIPEHRLYTLCTSAMSTVSASILGAYMTMIDPKYVITALVLNLFGGFMVANIINPYEVSAEEDIIDVQEGEKQTFFEVLGEYIMDGFKVAIIVGAMLIGFVALISMINHVFDLIFGVSFQTVLGYVFSPLAFIVGVPAADMVKAGTIMATKLLSNEFVAMMDLGKIADSLSSKTVGIISVFLVSFANFSSIGIITGAVKGLNEAKGNQVAKFGLKLLYGATLVSLLTAAITSIML
ncbi:NupC/NupG family nucleoside CNT transporter [Bacillus sp. 7884-1]|jgi:nucleoside transport protein|uniref:NupC/NupG family nucleoside CNT transporter n=1 Tax=Bacillus sp. 7884-1 TaxID=2021693 RepID=UPI00359C96AC